MQFPRGQIIAFEGLDHSFKETNFKQLVEYLRSNFSKECERGLITASFPRYGLSACYMVEQFLENRINSIRFRACYSDAVCSFYSMDRLHFWNQFHMFDNIKLTYMDLIRLPFSCFIFDRYSLSNAIYNPDNGEYITKKDILKEKEKFGNPLPTILVWFRMRDRKTYLNILSDKSGKDFNESDVSFMASVWDRTESLINSNILQECGISTVIIECLDKDGHIRTREDIFNDVLNGINEAINFREIGHDYPPKKESATITDPHYIGDNKLPDCVTLCEYTTNQEDE